MNSNFEFQIKVQEFVELIKENKKMDAIAYAKKTLSPFSTEYLVELKVVSTLLIFPPDTEVPKYKNYFSDNRYQKLKEKFISENYQLYGLPEQSLLETTLKSGFSSLKTWCCSENGYSNVNCPTCDQTFGKLAKDVENALHTTSHLVCWISGEIMDFDNPPMVLPNGYAYSKKALEKNGIGFKWNNCMSKNWRKM